MGCVGLWKHNGVLSEFGKIRETGKMCHVMSIDEKVTCMGWFNVLMTEFMHQNKVYPCNLNWNVNGNK